MVDSAGKELQKAEMKKASRPRHVGRVKRESTHGIKMPLGTYLARMKGEEESKEKCEELEKQYLKRLHAEVGECKSSESECSDDFKVETMSQEELKQIITGWESGVKVEHVPSAKEGESHYYVNVLLMSPAQGEKTEPKKVVKLSTDSKVANTDKDTDSANVNMAQCVNKALVNCGISEGKRRRMFMGKGVYSRAKSEKLRKSQRQTVKRRSSERAVFRGAVKMGKSVSKAKTDLMRLHYMGELYNAGAHYGHERITLPVRKVLKRACPSNKFGGDRMGEKNFSEQRNSFWRKMNTAECMVMKKPPQRLRCSSDRGGEPCVKKPEAALEDSSHVREEGLSYNNAGDNINVGSPLSDVVLRGKRIPKLSSPEKRVDQGYANDSERVFGIIAAIEKYVLYIAVTKYFLFQAITKYILFQAITKYILFQAITKFVLFQAITKFLLFQLYLQHIVATGKDDHGLLKNEIENYRSNDDEEELENCEEISRQNLAQQEDYNKDHTPLAVLEGSRGENTDEICEQSDLEALRLRGGANVWLTDEFEQHYTKDDVVEYFNAQRNSSNPDLTQNLPRLLKAVQLDQISKLIEEQDESTIVRVLKRYGLPWKRKDRRAQGLKMFFVKNHELQQSILHEIEVAALLSPTASLCQSDGSMSDSHISSPVTPSFSSPASPMPVTTSVLSPATPHELSPATPGAEWNFADRLWEMSREELMSFLAKENYAATRKPTSYCRDKVGVLMIKKLLKRIPLAEHRTEAVTHVMRKLKIEYRSDLARRESNLITKFCMKEVDKQEMLRKQVNILRELQLVVSGSSETRFTFPSPSNINEFVLPPLPNTSKVNFPNPPKFELHSPPKKRQKKNSPATEPIPDVLPSGDEHVPAVQATQVRFNNPSSYCYLNALLNLLYSNPEVMRVIHADSTEQQLIEKADGSVDILYELRRLSEIPVTGDSYFGEGVRGEPGDVTYLKNLLGNEWAGDAQQDAHALFNELCSRLKCQATEDLFQIIFQTTRQCHGPGCKPVEHEEYCDGLMLQPSGHMPAVDLYQSACQPEEFECVCQVKDCDSRRSTRSRVMALSGTAMVMILERYRFEAEGRVRNDASIAVPLSMVINNKLWYLTGTVRNTSGSDTTESGHYTGLRRDCDTGQFYLNNDSSPFEELKADEAQQFIDKSYMIMYCAEVALPRRRPPPIQVGPSGDQLAAEISAGREEPHEEEDQENSEQVATSSQAEDSGGLREGVNHNNQSGPKSKDVMVVDLAGDFHPTEKEQAQMREFAKARRVHKKELHARIQADNYSWHNLPPNPLLENLLRMESKLNNLTMEMCSHCDEQVFDQKLVKKKVKCGRCIDECRMCVKCNMEHKRRVNGEVYMWSDLNNMHVDAEVPDQLLNLTPVEQSAIQLMFVVMRIYKLNRGATFLKGHCLAVNQDLAEFATRLPPRPADLPMIFIIAPNQRVPLKANSHKILRALEWLKKNNEFYRDIEIDFEALQAYPSNDTDYVEGLNTIESAKLDEEADPSDAYTEEEGADIVTTSLHGAVPQATIKEEIKRYVLNEEDLPRIEWPQREKNPANENIRGAFTMMFPWLFPKGKGDITIMGPAGKPKFLAWVQHLLNHKSRRFAHDQRFIHYVANRYQKQQAMTLGNCFVKYHQKDIQMGELKEQVANDNLTTFSSLLYFARDLKGSRQHFRSEGKKALSLVNFIHIMSNMEETMNLFLTLSFADLHDPALHRLFLNSDKYLGKTVVNAWADVPEGELLENYILSSEDHRLRTQAVEMNGDIVCKYLDKKLWLFFEHVLRPMGVIDYILRVEFQYRSSEHFHMVLRLLDGVSVDDVHRAFSLSQFEVKGMDAVAGMPSDMQEKIYQDHRDVLASRELVADFSTFRIGQTAIHPQKDHKLWPGKEGLNKEKPRVNCLRRQFTDVVTGTSNQTPFPFQVPGASKQNTFPFQAPGASKQNTFPFQVSCSRNNKLPDLSENILADEAAAQRILDDAILMVNRLQLHNCTKRYCLKVVVGVMLLCKFDFPMKLEGFVAEKTAELFENLQNLMSDHPGARFRLDKLLLARNHPRIVVTISEFILGWRGNTNTRFVESVHQLIEYLLKYILKATSGSKSFENTVRDITNQAEDDTKVASVFQKLLMRNITEHDLSRTEAFRLMLGKDYVYYSRDFRRVNMMGHRMVVQCAEEEGEVGIRRRATMDNIADIYWERNTDPNYTELVQMYDAGVSSLTVDPREINLYFFAANFDTKWKLTPKTYVPLPSPLHKYPPDPRDKDPKKAKNRVDYLNAQLLLFKPGMRPVDLPESKEELEQAMREFTQTKHCPRYISDAFWKSWEKKSADEAEPEPNPLLDDPEPMDEADIVQDLYMVGLGAKLTAADRNNVNLIDNAEEEAEGLVDENPLLYTGIETDAEADWDSDRRLLGLSSKQVEDAALWLEAKKPVTEVPNQKWSEHFEPADLNLKQREVYDLMEHLVMGDEVQPGPRLIDLSGEAGTGKSRLIKTILYQSEKRCGDRSRIRVCAFTNSAAYSFIGGRTAHKLLRLDVERGPKGTRCQKQKELVGKRLQEFQEDFSNTRAVIIDEKSMIGCFDLWRIDQRLRQARPHQADQSFGGLVILLCGDLSQLPPVGDKALYYDGQGKMTASQELGRRLYAEFTECFLLKESMRQQGPENELFRKELRRLSDGTFNIEDWNRWEERSFDRLTPDQQRRFQTEGLKLTGRKADAVSFNEDGLKRCMTPILVVKSVNNNAEAKKTGDSEAGLPLTVPVAKGAAVVLTDNIWPEMGLMNGSKGTVTHIVFQEGTKPENSLPAFIIVAFPGYQGPPYLPDVPGSVPIHPRTAEWKDGKVTCTRRGFSLLPGYALTIHKAEGMTIDRPVLIDVGPTEFAVGLTYTAVTRTRTLDNISFQPMPTFNRIREIFKQSFVSKQNEVKKRENLAEEREVLIKAALDADKGDHGAEQVEKEEGEGKISTDTSPTSATANSSLDILVIDSDSFEDDAEIDPILAADDGVICEYPTGTNVTMRDYGRLRRNTYLNDVIISVGMTMIKDSLEEQVRDRLHIFNTTFFVKYFQNDLDVLPDIAPTPEQALEMHGRVADRTHSRRRAVNLFEKDIVLWPVHRRDHWFLIVACMNERVVYTLNSYNTMCEGQIVAHIQAYLGIEYFKSVGHDGTPPTFTHVRTRPPQQNDFTSCGLFAIHFSREIANRMEEFANMIPTGTELSMPFSPIQLRASLSRAIKQKSVDQGIIVESWPDLDLD